MNQIEKNVIMTTDMLCKSFISDGQVNNVIKNIDIELYKNDFTVVMGSSGSGKSTLLYLLSGMMESTSGKVFLDSREITNLKEKDMAKLRREKIGFVFQGINLIPDLSVFENVVSPTNKSIMNSKEIEERSHQLLKEMEMSDQKRKFPNQLSGGQKQRVAICRALMNNPDVVFADEPTGALNSTQGRNVLDIFTRIHAKGQCVVMVTHDLNAAIRGNRIIYLKDGRIDGDLRLDDYSEQDAENRELCIYKFLKERGW